MLGRLRVVNHDTVKSAVAQLPKDLNETYARILTEVEPDMVDKARRALLWLAVSSRPLYIEEITEACSVQLEGHDAFGRTRISPFNLYQMLRDLVSIVPRITETDPVRDSCHLVRLAHASVREFLTSHHIESSPASSFFVDMRHAHEFVAQRCLCYLYRYNSLGQRKARFPLRQYAWYHWEDHIFSDTRRADLGSPVRHLAVAVFEALSGRLQAQTVLQTLDENTVSLAQVQFALHLISTLQLSDKERLQDALRWPYFFPEFDSYQLRPVTHGSKSAGAEYKALGESEIRVLCVLPCLDKRANLLAVFRHVDLNRHTAYQAVSYVWAQYQKCAEITIDGWPVELMPHLSGMLRIVRGTTEKSQATLWIDSLSINQANPDERSQQIMLMPTIFQSATDVIVYLDSDQDLRQSVDEFKKLQAELSCSSKPAQRQDASGRMVVCVVYDPAPRLDHDRLRRVLVLFEHSHWRRSWIVSELVLASKLTIFYSSVSLNFSLVQQFADHADSLRDYWLVTGQVDAARQVDQHVGWSAVKDICLTRKEFKRGDSMPLPRLIYRFAAHVTGMSADKIFSMVGLASRASGSLVIKPDYGNGPDVLVRAVTEAILENTKSLDILSYWPRCSDQANTDLPSWMPQLVARPSEVMPLSPGCFGDLGPSYLYGASDGFPLERKSSEIRDRLVVKGVPVCQIVWTGQLEVEGIKVPSNTVNNLQGSYLALEDEAGSKDLIHGALTSIKARFKDVSLRGRAERDKSLLIKDVSHWSRAGREESILIVDKGPEGNITARESSKNMPPRHSGPWRPPYSVCIPSGQTAVEACWRTALADQWPRGKRLSRLGDQSQQTFESPGNKQKTFDQSPGDIAHGGCSVPPKTASEASDIMRLPGILYQFELLKGRTHFLTSNGLLGLGLDDIQVGDTVVVLFGGDVPYVLRPQATSDDLWEYRGEWSVMLRLVPPIEMACL